MPTSIVDRIKFAAYVRNYNLLSFYFHMFHLALRYIVNASNNDHVISTRHIEDRIEPFYIKLFSA